MSCGEIVITIFCGIVTALFLGSILVYCIGETIFVNRYNKFYETTEEGRKLYCALYTKDRLGSKHDWLVNQILELRDKIDEFEHYFPDECNEKDFIREMKNQYKRCSEDLAHVNEAMADWRKRIDEMVAALPKKYSGILEYNWRNAKVEVKEEDICW